ncbi:DUF4184 family protein [Alkanindiges illinoisensis]|uniref:DUF4184 family protein n=1 Tax=Alkanindiges illinoisensis TaxID=197183 RepID=A0A4Y7XDD4_9GAMM|nr:DUF4184 family protein [Alkanindiges illinoisensis]TEU26817.1 DUF4184 family protein [Alkanindiges illinoisensis]
MAFTLSHMAAVLPFYPYRRWVSFDALLIGSMLPDLPYVLSSNEAISHQSHQASGLLTYCLPMGLIVFILWYWLLKRPALSLIHPCHESNLVRHSMQRDSLSKWSIKFRKYAVFWLTVVLGLLLGTVTHLLWDGITHPDGFIASHVLWLQHPVNISYLGFMPVARLLQYATSVLGLLFLIFFAWRWLQQGNLSSANFKCKKIILKGWHRVLIVSLLGASSLATALQAGLKWHNLWFSDNYLFIAKVMVGFLQGMCSAFFVYALLYQCVYYLDFCRKRKY